MDNEDPEEGEAVELANVDLREEMLRFNIITDAENHYPLAKLLAEADRKVLVPVYRDAQDPDGLPDHGTLYKCTHGLELHVFTSVLLIPEECPAPDVCFYPVPQLILDIIEQGQDHFLYIDPGTDHGVGIAIKNGTTTMYGLKRLERLMKDNK